MKPVTWLHISDLHLNVQGSENDRIRDKLFKFLKSRDIRCDYIFMTGDLRSASEEGAFSPRTIDFLNNLCGCVHISKDKFFIVPGNHDIIRDDPVRMQAVNRIIQEGPNKYYDFKQGVIQREELEQLYYGKKDYIELLEKFYDDNNPVLKNLHDPLKPHFTVETEDFNILLVDSTLVYSKTQQSDLILGHYQLRKECELLNPNKPTILLSHYSFDSLHRNEQKSVYNLMKDFNIQLWLSGHEHDKLIRKQWDFFYECQCGNLIYEDDQTKPCVYIGEYDPDSYSGSIRMYYWLSPDGWTEYPLLYNDSPVYLYELQDIEAKVTQIKNTAELRKIDDNTYLFDLNTLNREMLDNLTEEGFCYVKSQLGNRLNGNESKDEVKSMFLDEVKMTLNSQKRYDCMPMFQNVVRGVYDGYLYLDKNFIPLFKVKIYQFYMGNVDFFQIYSDSLQFEFTIHEDYESQNKELIYMSVGYDLSQYSDVLDRIKYFEEVQKYLAASEVFIKMIGNEEYNISYTADLMGDEKRSSLREETDLWYELMQKIAQIEEYYNIKFCLPKKAEDRDYEAIEIISNSIRHKSCRHLPGMPDKHPGFRRKFTLDQDVFLNEGDKLPKLSLFGYSFKPVSQYLMKGEFVWNRDGNIWESKSEKGFPLWVEFELDKEEFHQGLLQGYQLQEIRKKLKGSRLTILDTKEAEFFQYYVNILQEFMEYRKDYYSYKEHLDDFIIFDCKKDKKYQFVSKDTGNIINKVTANELLFSVVNAGEKLLQEIDDFAVIMGIQDNEKCKHFGDKWTNNNLGYLFLNAMKTYEYSGYFPLSLTNEGVGFFDFQRIINESRAHSYKGLNEIFDMLYQLLIDAGLDINRINLYDMIRNYIYIISIVNLKYILALEPEIHNLIEHMDNILNSNANLLVKTGPLKNHIVYRIKGENIAYVFENYNNLLTDFIEVKKSIQEDVEQCSQGVRNQLPDWDEKDIQA